jgi:hypothetical protein
MIPVVTVWRKQKVRLKPGARFSQIVVALASSLEEDSDLE